MTSTAGIIAVAIGVGGILLIALATLAALVIADEPATEIVATGTAAFGVVGSICGAYFGIKLGNDRSSEASEQQAAADAKAKVYALRVPEQEADRVEAAAERAAGEARQRLRET